jgi:hypothetical protein
VRGDERSGSGHGGEDEVLREERGGGGEREGMTARATYTCIHAQSNTMLKKL